MAPPLIHESLEFYKTCLRTKRNTRLFLGGQNLKGNTARYTRQNPNGARRGYECPEERDYWPYWRPTPWVDVAYFTNNVTLCPTVTQISANVAARYSCQLKNNFLYMKNNMGNTRLPITETECNEMSMMVDMEVPMENNGAEVVVDGVTQMTTETMERFIAKWEIDNGTLYNNKALKEAVGTPLCYKNTWSKDNHHGNVKGGDFVNWDWKVPDYVHESCVLRLRYNISTTDLPHLNAEMSSEFIGVNNKYYVAQNFGYNSTMADATGYIYKNNPQVNPFYGYKSETGQKFEGKDDPIKFQLAVNTAQFGRTFEDRSHRFSIKARPANTVDKNIINLGVRGKRGNIVQTYPATEYSFQPESMEMLVGDYLHIQWVGSNTNPNNNAGQGRQGSDRHNIATLKGPNYWEVGQPAAAFSDVHGQFGNSYPANVEKSPFLNLENSMVQKLATLKGVNTNGGELSELDDAGTWASFPLIEVTTPGLWHYMCTRNNNFSNRSQKGKISIKNPTNITTSAQISYSGASVESGGAKLVVAAGSMIQGDIGLKSLGKQHDPNGYCHPRCASQYYLLPMAPPKDTKTTFQIPYDDKLDSEPKVFYSTQGSINAPSDSWHAIDSATCSDGMCSFSVSHKAVYVVWNEFHWWVYLLSILAVCCVCLIGGGIFYKVKNK